MKRYKLWKGLPEVQWDLAVCSNEAVRGKKRKTIEFYFGYLVFEVLGDRRNMLLRKTLESQKEAENVGLLLQRKVRTGRKRSRDQPQRRDISQKQSKQKRETLRELVFKPHGKEEVGRVGGHQQHVRGKRLLSSIRLWG